MIKMLCFWSSASLTLTVKKSRAIRVQGKDYRYQVSTTQIDEDWNFSLNVTIQRWSPPRGIVEVKGLVTRDYWLDFSDGKRWEQGEYPILLPMHVEKIVVTAITTGWAPKRLGKPFKLDTDNGAIFKT